MEYDFKNVSAKSLECPVCMKIFKEPKILSCSHTFCKSCLVRLLECQETKESVKCPVCRVESKLQNANVHRLPTNLAVQSLLDEAVKKRSLRIRRKASAQSRRKCRQHTKEEDQCFCCNCRKYVCIKCGVTEHVYKKHQIIDASEQESNQRKAVEELKSKAHKRKCSIKNYIDIVTKQEVETSKAKKQCIDDINRAHKEAVQQLSERKKILVQDVTRRFEHREEELHSLKEKAQQQTNQVITMTDLVANKNQVLLETEALVAHITLRENLEKILDKQNLDNDYPVKLVRDGGQIVFRKNVKTKDFDLGSISMISEKNATPNIANTTNSVTFAAKCCTPGFSFSAPNFRV